MVDSLVFFFFYEIFYKTWKKSLFVWIFNNNILNTLIKNTKLMFCWEIIINFAQIKKLNKKTSNETDIVIKTQHFIIKN